MGPSTKCKYILWFNGKRMLSENNYSIYDMILWYAILIIWQYASKKTSTTDPHIPHDMVLGLQLDGKKQKAHLNQEEFHNFFQQTFLEETNTSNISNNIVIIS